MNQSSDWKGTFGCQSIIGALACAPATTPASGLRSHWCQSIIGALACAPRQITPAEFATTGVSRSLARSPARHPLSPRPRKPRFVSVDHWRARLRAGKMPPAAHVRHQCQSIIGALACAPCRPTQHPKSHKCQSIIGALACAPRAAAGFVAQQKQCQSIIGALACAPQQSLADHQRRHGVSRSLARSPARRFARVPMG